MQLNFATANINGTYLIDQPILNYSFTGIGGRVNFKDTQYGVINFLDSISGSGRNLSNDVQIKNNLVSVNSSQTGLNKTANITLLGVPLFIDPTILRDDVICPSSICTNFTNLTGTVIFNVLYWSNYSIGGTPDIISPEFFNLSATPSSPTNYSSGATYQFNSTWTDNDAVNNVKISFNWINYTVAVSSTPNVYNFTILDLSAGNYTYYWIGSDISGNTNTTNLFNYTVNKAIPPISISISPLATVSAGVQTTTNGLDCPTQLTCNLFQGTVGVSNPHTNTFGVGIYPYTFNTTGNMNYTSNSITANLTVQTIVVPATPISCPENQFGFYNPDLPHIAKAGCI